MALLYANLDCEARWSGAPLPGAVRALIAAAGTTMRAFARPGDRLWTPAAIDPARLPPVPGLPEVELVTGALPPDQPVLAWGQTDEVAGAPPIEGPPPFGASCEPAIARRCNDHGFAWELADQHRWPLPGATAIDSVAALERHLAGGGAAAGAGAWVVRAPLAASGRERLRQRGSLDRAGATRLERLLAAHGRLYFEPWVERLADAGCCGFVGATGAVDLAPVHGLDNDPTGVFRGITVGAVPGLEPVEVVAVARAAVAAGEHLAAAGYRGPFGIDAYVWQDGRRRALQPLSEINARLSFGWIARELARRARPEGEVSAFALRAARTDRPARSESGQVEILLAGAPDGASAVLSPAHLHC
jgi:hypothetical protein